jgi:hypothetical protein
VSNGLVRVYPAGEAAYEDGDYAPIGTARADSSGHFSVTLTAQGQQIVNNQAAVNGGIANVEIAADNGNGASGMAAVEVPVSTSAKAEIGATPAPATVMMETQPITTENHNWSCPPQGIIRKAYIKRFERWVQVGEANMAYGDSNATFSYGRSADSSITTGFSVDGGLFHNSGTRHIGNTEGAAVGMSTAGANQLKVLSRFVYKEGRGRYCDSRHHHYQTFGLGAVRWVKAVSKDHQHDTLNRCPVNTRTVFPKNASFSRTHNHFERFHRGVSIEPSYRGWGISFHGGSESGASTKATLHVRFGHQHNRYLACGEHGHTVFNGKRTYSGQAT